ncbi:hypothetical protein KFE25_003349 [Diacronema lutheri]|uniref:TraB/GumN family protein n=2 Tax=Diacronema lutheri TaxID=2081491 RepID=A0A8J6CAP1_DIALT|nr:hypothetical protein KFE25_003349 [Diacronema lutheri]
MAVVARARAQWVVVAIVIVSAALATPAVEAGAVRLSRRHVLARTGAALGGTLLGAGGAPALRPSRARAANVPAYCDEAIDVLASPTRKIYLCGTAHVSQDSALLVRSLIRSVRPSSVMIELDEQRFASLMASPAERKRAKGDSDLLRGLWADLRGPGSLADRIARAQSNAIGRSLSQLYESMEGLGFESGDEFRVAATEALDGGAQLVLGDQDVRTTLDSLRDALRSTDLRALFGAPPVQLDSQSGERQAALYGLASAGGGEEMDKEALGAMIATLKERQNTRAIVLALQESTPALYTALIAQRDAFMARSLDAQCAGSTIVAVVGMAHLDGIGRALLAADPTLTAQPKRGCHV